MQKGPFFAEMRRKRAKRALGAQADEMFDEAENRLHAQKAVPVKWMGNHT